MVLHRAGQNDELAEVVECASVSAAVTIAADQFQRVYCTQIARSYLALVTRRKTPQHTGLVGGKGGGENSAGNNNSLASACRSSPCKSGEFMCGNCEFLRLAVG